MATITKIAAVLLVAGLSSQLAEAGIKGLFSGPAAKNYAILADHLFTATQSSELADNARAAESLLAKHPDANEDLVSLTNAFKSLKVDESDPESVCSKDNLASLRNVTGHMREGGNLGPNKITEPVRRLNRMLNKYIAQAVPLCSTHLATKSWPSAWNPSFSNRDMEGYVRELGDMPLEFSYASYLSKPSDPKFERYRWGARLSHALAQDVRWEDHNLDRTWDKPATTTDKTLLALQVHEYVYKPCKEFVAFEEVNNVLVPNGDLLVSRLMTDAQYGMPEYFKDTNEPRQRAEFYSNINSRVKQLVAALGACQRFLTMPEKDVVHQVHESRVKDEKAGRDGPPREYKFFNIDIKKQE